MSLNWEWNRKCGTVTQTIGRKDYTFDWYEGNALMIAICEFTENGTEKYQLQWFFCDEGHAKNCLGLSKGHECIFDDGMVKSLTIYRENSRHWEKIVKLFAKAFPDIEITVKAKAPA